MIGAPRVVWRHAGSACAGADSLAWSRAVRADTVDAAGAPLERVKCPTCGVPVPWRDLRAQTVGDEQVRAAEGLAAGGGGGASVARSDPGASPFWWMRAERGGRL